MTEKDQLESAITAIRRGEAAQGRKILVGLLKANPKNELAWLWLVRSLPDDTQRIAALERCLKVIPESKTALQALNQLRSRQAASIIKPAPQKQIEPQPLPGREESARLPNAKPTPLNDRLAQIEAAPKEKTSSAPQKIEPARPVVVRRYEPPSRPIQKPRRRISIRFILQVLLGGILLIVIATVGWIAFGIFRTPKVDLAHQASLSTAASLETQNASLREQVAERQTQAAVQSTPTHTPSPAATRTPRPTPTATSTPTPVPTQIGATSLIGPNNVSSLVKTTEFLGDFFAAVAFSPDGSLLAGASANGITVWDAQNLEPLRQIFLENNAESVVFSLDGSAFYFTQSGEDNKSYLFGTASTDFNTLLTGIEFPNPSVDLFVSADNATLVLASFANSANINLVDSESGTIQSRLDHTGGLLAASLKPNSTILATAGYNDLVQIWDLENQQVKTVLSAHNADIISLEFSTDGVLLASASQDGVIRVWNAENWKLAATFDGHTLPVQAMAFSPDHRLLISIDSENQIIAWDTATSNPVQTFSGPSGLKDLAFSVDGGYLVLAGDQSIEIWSLPTP